MVKLNNFADFIVQGGNLLFHSNIRSFLNNTDINKGIKRTLENESEKFWFYNNGITIVCDTYEFGKKLVTITSPQIVNGCQTAKSIERFFNTITRKETSKLNIEGNVLVKIIRPKTSDDEENRKRLRDNITRYTNSQNAVKGLDFYSLDEFQKGLQSKFEKIGYYYEIQRGAFIALDKPAQAKYTGLEYYQYLVPSNFKFTLPAKEVIQAYTAGIKLMPNIAYGKPKELTPVGDKWGKICNEDTKNLDAEFFLYPYLVFIYCKSFMGYSSSRKNNDFRRACSLILVSTYYLILMESLKQVQDIPFEKPEEIDIKTYRTIFMLSELNTKLLRLADNALKDYFGDSKIEEEVADDLKNFLKVKVTKKDNWSILERKVKRSIDQEILDLLQQALNQ